MKIGVLIPTRGDRPEFLEYALKQLSKQTRRADAIRLFDEPPKSTAPDVTYRYRKGYEELKALGCELIAFWEDDDFYRGTYLATLEKIASSPSASGKALIGIEGSIYYNIRSRRWVTLIHKGRASMSSTAIIPANVPPSFKWCDDNYSYTDVHVWKSLPGYCVPMNDREPMVVGIKHGIGLSAGGGHVFGWGHYNQYDKSYQALERFTTKEAAAFYERLARRADIYSYRLTKRPTLSIVTRVLLGKRPTLFRRHLESVYALEGGSLEQIFIVDRHGDGMLSANASFQLAKPLGEWVYLLDDDDYFLRRDFITMLSGALVNVASNETPFGGLMVPPDVVFFKMFIRNGDGDELFPKPGSWNTRKVTIGQIGGSCFAVRRWVFEKYIRFFAAPRCGDYHFISRVLADDEVKASWIPVVYAETGKVSRGGAE